MSRVRGFTLLELLVVLVVIVIMASVAVPGFQRMMAVNRMAADFNSVLTGLNYARSEAIKRRTEVTFELTETRPDKPWEYEVRVGDGGGIGELIRQRSARDGNVSLNTTLSDSSLTFGALGTLKNNSGCPSKCRITLSLEGIDDRVLEVSSQGRVGRRDGDES